MRGTGWIGGYPRGGCPCPNRGESDNSGRGVVSGVGTGGVECCILLLCESVSMGAEMVFVCLNG